MKSKVETNKPGILDKDLKEKVFRDLNKNYKNCNFPNSFEYGGSNPFLIAAANKILPDYGYRIARLSESIDIFPDYYFDLGLVLKNNFNEKNYLLENIIKQIKKIDKNPEFPIKIDLADLILINDTKTVQNCYFKLKDNPLIAFGSSILNSRNGHFSNEDRNKETGLPKQLNPRGNWTLFNKQKKLSDLSRIIVKGLSINSSFTDLAYSYSAGRILIMKND
ncbi:MAG: hypothetical protein Q7S33_01850 [Nanoarchaeota archaeon]|nr:hypothetical protein [Nanoarchaeota archaeon]